MKKKFAGLSLKVSTLAEDQQTAPYIVTASGTFQEGDFLINRKGLRIQGTTPATTRRVSTGSDGTNGFEELGLPQSPKEVELDIQLSNARYEELLHAQSVGHGSSGCVKKVVHAPTGAEVVLKEISVDLSSEPLRKQITTELRTLYGSYHPNVVKYYNAFFEQDSFAILMEFMDAGSLADLMNGINIIPEAYVAAIAKQVLRGLNYVHKELRVVHRDLKPSNLLLNRQGHVKIADFGVSSQLASTMAVARTFVGTMFYMSPERITGEQSYSFASDIWSVGLLLLECAIGHFPYYPNKEGSAVASFFDVFTKVVGDDPPIPDPSVHSPEFCDFISRCLHKDPVRRSSAAELLCHPFLAATVSTATLSEFINQNSS